MRSDLPVEPAPRDRRSARAPRRSPASTGPALRERGMFTFVEVMLATLILALSATATAYWVETVGNLSEDADEQTVGLSIVQVIEGVISPLPYREPGGTTFGPEGRETVADFDDIDDFDGLVSSPPFDADRLPQTALAGWTARVEVTEVDPQTLLPATDSGLRMVRVEVERQGKVIAGSWWLRARSPFE